MSELRRIASGLWRLPLMPLDAVNVYLLDDVLVDAGGGFATKRLIAALAGRKLSAHALTHAHFDHQGGSHAVCEHFDIPLWCGAGDRAAMESGELTRIMPDPGSLLARLGSLLGGPAHPVARALEEGDEVGGFRVLETPGHTPGHLAFWRETDQVLILGDVAFHRNPVTLRLGLTEPFRLATHDPPRNRESARRLAALEPAVICFGHGPPLKDPEAFQRFVSRLSPA